MSVDAQIKRLVSNNPPIVEPDHFARQCAEAIEKHRRADLIVGTLIGAFAVLGLIGSMVSPTSAKSAGTLVALSVPYFVPRMLARHRLRELLTTQHPDAAMKAGVKAGMRVDHDTPRYARKK